MDEFASSCISYLGTKKYYFLLDKPHILMYNDKADFGIAEILTSMAA